MLWHLQAVLCSILLLCFFFFCISIGNPKIGITLIAQPACHNIVWLQAYKSQMCSACPAEEASCLLSSSTASCLAVAVLLLAILVYSCKATQRCKLLSTTALYSCVVGWACLEAEFCSQCSLRIFKLLYRIHNTTTLPQYALMLACLERRNSIAVRALLQYTTRDSIVGGPGS